MKESYKDPERAEKVTVEHNKPILIYDLKYVELPEDTECHQLARSAGFPEMRGELFHEAMSSIHDQDPYADFGTIEREMAHVRRFQRSERGPGYRYTMILPVAVDKTVEEALGLREEAFLQLERSCDAAWTASAENSVRAIVAEEQAKMLENRIRNFVRAPLWKRLKVAFKREIEG